MASMRRGRAGFGLLGQRLLSMTLTNGTGSSRKFEGYCTDVWFREGMRFIERKIIQSRFCFISHRTPRTAPIDVPLKNGLSRIVGDRDVPNPNFYGMIANIDHNMGLLRTKSR